MCTPHEHEKIESLSIAFYTLPLLLTESEVLLKDMVKRIEGMPPACLFTVLWKDTQHIFSLKLR